MRLFYIILFIIWLGLIIYLSGIPRLSTGTQGFLIRKLGHSFVFAVLTFLLWKSIYPLKLTFQGQIILCGIIILVFAITDEIHQSFVVGRRGNYKGVLFDVIGGGAVLMWFWVNNKLRRAGIKSADYAD